MNEKRIRKFTKKKGNCVTKKKRSIQKHKVVTRKQIFFG